MKDATIITGLDGRSYEVRTKLDGFEVWRDGDDVGSFLLGADGHVTYQGRFTGKIDEVTMGNIVGQFAAQRRGEV